MTPYDVVKWLCEVSKKVDILMSIVKPPPPPPGGTNVFDNAVLDCVL